ncbi:hypothetical protein I6G82_07430 [Lysinibacillus macroides]|uniref:Uncharacterized protein n=1 Tax=Lysinibacillus macroides TaxID=33935 RepID=A0A0N0CWW1_9BACI|nr:hypothetical protein [Lysinibacillus macroides]KOY83544.1 hypothetical protein ADM90_09930 [Lysinibacillus macroides]QPR69422.1 hypothetical protein I6G82_07430 [Lysinibacillus macroides]
MSARKPFMGAIMLLIMLVPVKALATSWVYLFVVWNGYIYVVGDEQVTSLGEKIGAVTVYSDMEQYEGNFSNIYPEGTSYYAIKGVDTDHAIAVHTPNDTYVKALREGEYTYVEKETTLQKSIWYKTLGGIVAIDLGIIFLVRRFKKRAYKK